MGGVVLGDDRRNDGKLEAMLHGDGAVGVLDIVDKQRDMHDGDAGGERGGRGRRRRSQQNYKRRSRRRPATTELWLSRVIALDDLGLLLGFSYLATYWAVRPCIYIYIKD